MAANEHYSIEEEIIHLTPEERATIKVTNDYVFRCLFGDSKNESLLLSLINAVQRDSHQPEVRSVSVTTPFNYKKTFDDKESITDVKAVAADGEIFDIEMQVLKEGDYIKRTLYYAAHNISSQLKKGDHYSIIHPVIGINVLAFNLFTEDTRPHHFGQIMEVESKKVLTHDLGLHFLELTKLKNCGNLDSELREWFNFFLHGHEEDYMVSGASSAVVTASEWFKNFKENDYMSSKAFLREKFLRDQAAIGKAGWEDGREEGIKEGRAEGSLKKAKALAKKFMALGHSKEEAAEFAEIDVKLLD